MTAPAPVLAHVTAVRDLLDAQLPAAVTVEVGSAPAGQVPPYAVIYPDPGMPEGTLGDRHRDLLLEFQVTCVGTGQAQAQDVADRVRAVLLTWTPAVAGRTVQPLWQVVSGERVRRDDDVNPPLYYLPLIFQMRTGP
jgi:hypothetical protein